MSDNPVFHNEFTPNSVRDVYQGTINLQRRTPVPFDLFNDPPEWTNHADRLDALMRWIALPNPRPLVIKGPKGTGKSALVGVAACRRREHLPGGVLHLEPRRHGLHAEMVAALERLGASGISGDPATTPKHYRSLLADSRCLVVIDEPRSKREIEALWPPGSRGLCIVLTAKDLRWGGADQIELPPLEAEHALDLLARASSLSPEVNRELVAAFGGYPGKLLRAAGIITVGDISVEKLVALAGAHDDERLFLEAFDGIGDGAKRLYRALCSLPDPVFERSLLDHLERTAPEDEEPVDELETERLLYEIGPGLWRVQHRPEGTDTGGPND